ncbi:hypothetical protein Tdes44962_MAKER01632 [Teratosphaeria destructans]|uniref:Uncharacterized protein n=1 Tax=Teratosphaeria destructans TaxID=418781 RepID=A0A9W7SY23_9PEZI|nr:hypothetical protein Tdes44962_MAKER01632 [Teratosphaeria destructans]
MMPQEEFPLPAVADALEPFIKPREEVYQIRQELQKHVQRQLKSIDVPLTAANLTTAPEGDLTEFTSPPLTGVRRAYLKALQAHTAAQSRFESLKADLAKLNTEQNEPSASADDLVHESYLPLLRQRERQRRLLVLDRTFAQIDAAGKGVVDGHLDDIVKQSAGELPTPPPSQPASSSDKADVNTRILALKKAVLSAKRSVEDAQNGRVKHRPGSNTSSKSSTEVDVAGLQRALNELTGWMEHQLAVIGEADTAIPQSAHAIANTNGHVETAETASSERVEQLYEQYIAARQHLIETVNNPPPPDSESSPSSPVLERSTNSGTNSNTNSRHAPAAVMLPYIASLTTHKQFESSLLQQSAYLRKVIHSAEEETQRLLSLKADESHLVHPGASRGVDWEVAGAEAGKATIDAAMQRLKVGQQYVKDAESKITAIEGLPRVFDKLAR